MNCGYVDYSEHPTTKKAWFLWNSRKFAFKTLALSSSRKMPCLLRNSTSVLYLPFYLPFHLATYLSLTAIPRISNKEKQRREIFHLYVKSRFRHGNSHRITKRWRAYLEAFVEERYMEPRVRVPKSDWARDILPQYSDTRWRSFARISPESFRHILGLISNNSIFYNNANPQQTPIETQLKIALWKLANNGSVSGFRPSASQWGVSEGHIYDYTRRVVVALFQLRQQYIK